MRALLASLVLLIGPAAGAAAAGSVPPANPYAGPDGTASMHGDSAASDTTPWSGPGPGAGLPQPVLAGGVCPTILAGADRLPQVLCTSYLDRSPVVHLVDPASGEPMATLPLKAGSLLGGVYAYVDHHDRLVTVDGSRSLLLIAHDRSGPGGTWRLWVDRRVPIPLPTDDAVVSVNPGYDGRVWFATQNGRAGTVDTSTGAVSSILLRSGEKVANSIASSPDGTAVATTHATYLLRADAGGKPIVRWRRAYDRGPARKPGQLSHGTGATPTFFGPRTGREYLTITDNAAPREHLLVYRAATGERVCATPILGSDNSGTENSPIGIGNRVYVASTYGYPYPAGADGPSEPASAPFVGGLERIDVTSAGCHAVWETHTRSAAVPRFARGEDVIYTVTRSGGLLDTWSLARISPESGAVLSSQPLGVGPLADTLQMVGTILPDGTLYQGNLTGWTVVRPS